MTRRLPTCSSCKRPIRWGVTTLGARMPLDPDPQPDGTVWIRPDGRYRVLTKAERQRAVDAGQALYHSHHYTCESAAKHRRVSRDQMSLGVGS